MKVSTCQHCNQTTINPNEWHRLTLKNRGGRVAYLCPACARRLMNYSARNSAIHGKRKAQGGHSYSIELETNNPTLTARIELMQDASKGGGFIPTSDCTVDVEFKSPIYYSLNPLIAKLKSIESLMTAGELSIGDNCGTHLHIGLYDASGATSSEWVTGYCTRYYRALFEPLANILRDNPAAARAVFGRELGQWASYPSFYYVDEHTNFINVQHNYTLEFRLCKFVNAAQYANCIRFCDNMVSLIQGAMKYENTTDRIRKARQCGVKIAKAFARYYLKTREF